MKSKKLLVLVHHIWGVGTKQRYMYFVVCGKMYHCRIDNETYTKLKNAGVPTSQKICWYKKYER